MDKHSIYNDVNAISKIYKPTPFTQQVQPFKNDAYSWFFGIFCSEYALF